MSQLLISHDPELQKLQSEGYELEVRDGLIIVHHVPYLDSQQNIQEGKLIFCISPNNGTIGKPIDHTAYWCGSMPYCTDGTEVPSLINSFYGNWNGFDSIFYLSLYPDSLPDKRYPDHYKKIMTYYNTIAGHAAALDGTRVRNIQKGDLKIVEDDIFVYQDTNSSRSGLLGVTAKLNGKKVAIVGLGGTGGYLLDYLSKMPVCEIHLYDGDVFSQHNAFRAPGAASTKELGKHLSKVAYFHEEYSKIHKHIISHEEYVDENNIDSLCNMDVVFICVDSVRVRNFISRHLMERNVSFVDSGLGLTIGMSSIGGQVRATSFYGGDGEYIRHIFGSVEVPDDGIYNTNIQICMLNSLAAIMMLESWLKQIGFFSSINTTNNLVYNVNMGKFLT